MNNPWLQTYTGRAVDLIDPQPDMFDIVDLAVGISRDPRFAGQTRVPYYTGQHSVHVMELVSKENKFPALMHDTPEGLLRDIPKPLKNLIPEYEEVELRFWKAIAFRWNLPVELPVEVKMADSVMCMTEKRDLMADPPKVWKIGTSVAVPGIHVEPWSSEVALKRFLAYFEMLTGEPYSLKDLAYRGSRFSVPKGYTLEQLYRGNID